ncbi:hypothetical protein [Enterococcus sp. DIV0876]|uniref:hypothetical protein n=1 Tax=Enterococcus sp. DIV0876 TaxID=2774633 RepID=UPI003D3002B4
MSFSSVNSRLEMLSETLVFNVTDRRRYYVYLDYSVDGSNFYYVGKGTGPRKDIEQRNEYHSHFKKQKGLDRRIVLDRLTSYEAELIENLFIHYARENGIYLTNKIIQEYMFKKEFSFDQVLNYYCNDFLESTYSKTWVREKLFGNLNKFVGMINPFFICFQAIYLAKESTPIFSDEFGFMVKDSLLNMNKISEKFLTKLLSDMIAELNDEDFEWFCYYSARIAHAVDADNELDIQLLQDRCIRNLVSNLPMIV